ncbi:acyltransferase 3 [Boeremia exigua]|uniref:acyltransferase 3 n=1 Tax=Boeremia exigua TaxID=749465 RepID=UPI001E8DD2C3|nr:acyltransferase 3 [Boeremia exigua]KAH6613121.1 acyltransferase 3 [Boeremia exigua]
MAAKLTPPDREIWLDGLRGVAAVIVVWFHMTAGKLDTPYQSFWDAPASANRHFFQLVPFRTLFAGPGMVDIFFVVSGYSISVRLIKLRHEGSFLVFYQRLTSSVVRRMFRLCFPVAVMMVGSHVLYYAGAYTITFRAGTGCPGAEPWRSPVPHIQCLVRSFISIINAENIQNLTLNDHFWTIPVEIRGSMKVYLTLFGLSNVREPVRKLIIVLLCLRSWWNGTPEFMAFFSGVLFAESNASAMMKQPDMQTLVSSSHRDHQDSSKADLRPTRMATLMKYLVFLLGIYLVSLPIRIQSDGSIDANFPPDWFFLKLFPPLSWWNTETTMRTWHTFGAILVVGSMRVLHRLRAPFETRAAQFLGHISFSLYLCHQTVLRIMLHWALHWTSLCVTGVGYLDAYTQGNWTIVFVAWILTVPLITTVLLLTSVYMAKAVDQRSIVIGSKVERLLCK